MKLLFLCNIPSVDISAQLNMGQPNIGGWITSLYDKLCRTENITMHYAFPFRVNKEIRGAGKSTYYGFPLKAGKQTRYDKRLERLFIRYLLEVKPDIIQIFGTEFPHALAMVNAAKSCGMLDRVILTIQGLISKCALHYTEGLSKKAVTRWTFRDIIRMDNINYQQRSFKKRGSFEIAAIKNVKHIVGRTTWDKACIHQINPEADYHHIDEMLRDGFHAAQWCLDNCKQHTIFLSGASYPIKGAHYMIEALPTLLKNFPDTHLYIAGNKMDDISTLKQRLRMTSYQCDLIDRIRRLNLSEHVTFTGPLDEQSMIRTYLNSHVFVSPSTIENSPNALCEAMLLGLPIVASNVGGVSDLMTHGEDGYTYHSTAPYMIAHYITEIFKNDDLAVRFSNQAQKHAKRTHDLSSILSSLLTLYQNIA